MTGFDGFYHAEPVEEEGWEGFRLLSHTDEVYEAVTDGAVEMRVYGDEAGWDVAVRFPTETDEDAYERWEAVSDRIRYADGPDLAVDGLTFHEEKDGGMDRGADGITLRYTQDGAVAVPEHSYGRPHTGSMAEAGVFLGGFGGMGAGFVGSALGLAEPLLLPLALGTWAAGVIGLPVAGKTLPATAERINNWRSRRKYGSEDRIADVSLLERINERNALERYLEQVRYEDAASERYEELDEADMDETLAQLLETHFDRFDQQEGVLALKESETYEDATAFASTVTGTPYTPERPRIIDDRDRFATVLRHCTFDDALIDEGRSLIRRVVEEAADDAVESFVEDEWPDVTREVAATASLERTPEGGR